MKRLTGIIPAFLAGLLPVLPLRAFVPAHDLSAALPTNTTFGVQSPAFGVRRSFDPAGRLSTVGSAGVPPATEISFALSYDAQDGGLASVSNAVFVETRSRDLSGNVTNIACKTHSGAFLASFAYCYDAAGLVTQKVGFVNGSAWTNAYTYDARGRLMAENLYKSGSSTVTAFSYDMAGNRLTAGASNFSYSNNRLGGVLHDAAGNITNMVRGGVTLGLAWNTLGQLVSVTTNGAFAESYTYDPLGRRVSTTEGRGTVWHAYDGDECMADLDASGNPLRSYSWGPGVDNLLAVTVYSADATNTYYAVKDHLGSVHALVDESGQLAAQFSYDAWGAPEVSSFLLPPSSFQFRYLFQGREYSAATGLYNFRARWYAPEFGRWLSPDPIGLEGGLNLYEFCRNDPVNFRDPSGLIAGIDNLAGAGVGTIAGWAVGGYTGYRSGARGWDLAYEVYKGGAVGAVSGFMYEAMLAGSASLGMGVLGAGLIGAEAGMMSRAMDGYQYGYTPCYDLNDLANDMANGATWFMAGSMAGQAFNSLPRPNANAQNTPATGQKVYRVWGQEPTTPDLVSQQSGPWGGSWTRVDPRTVPNYRNAAGLPDNANLGRFVSEGGLIDTSGITARDALRIGNNFGGLDELIIPNPEQQIILDSVSGVNPSF